MHVKLENHDPKWSNTFSDLAAQMTSLLGDKVVSIDHIGSTAIPGINAKPIIDIQVTVNDLEDVPLDRLAEIGFHPTEEQFDARKIFLAREDEGTRSAHIHLRTEGDFSASSALLFRDYLIANSDAAARYESVKIRLAAEEWESANDYADAKGDTVWALLREADLWASHGGGAGSRNPTSDDIQ